MINTEQFFKLVRKTRSCWIWKGKVHKHRGSGQITSGGVHYTASRLAYQLLVGPVGDKTKLFQTCGEKLCVNPEHLMLGTVENRLWAMVYKTDTCWLWTGHIHTGGYGTFKEAGKFYAHQFTYEWAKGALPGGLEIAHTCSNRHCVNPDHLEPTALHGRRPKDMA